MLTLIAIKLGHSAWKKHKRKKYAKQRANLLHENKLANRVSTFKRDKRERVVKLKKRLPKYHRGLLRRT